MPDRSPGLSEAPPEASPRRALPRRSTALTVLLCLVVGVPAAIGLTPDQDVVTLGQQVSVGARPPSATLSGPAQLVQLGNTELDIPIVRVWGPLRPRLTLGPMQRNAEAAQVFTPQSAATATQDATAALVEGFVRWYAWAGLCLLVLTAAICAAVGHARVLVVLRRQARADPAVQLSTAEIWQDAIGSLRRTLGLALLTVTVAWAVCGVLAYVGTTRGLRSVHSLSDLVGAYQAAPAPVGPPLSGYAGAVIGDSRVARVGGPPVPGASAADRACGRSADSPAAELERTEGVRVLNLACSSATVSAGVRGPQQRGDVRLPPQLGVLRQVRDLRFVVVAVGPNDVSWTDFLRYCYGSSNCSDNLSQGEFDYRLAAFDRDYGRLLTDLDQLPGRPRVIVLSTYRAFGPDADCADSRGSPPARGLDRAKIAVLDHRTDQLDAVLAEGARKFGFAVADPALTPLCATSGGPADLQGLDDPFPFHPTAAGSRALAAAVAAVVPEAPEQRASR